MEREKVYEAISSERNYQEEMTKRSDRPDIIPEMHVGDALAAMQYNLNKAYEAWYKGSVPHIDTLTYMRKIAALCVQTGEQYGMEERNPNG